MKTLLIILTLALALPPCFARAESVPPSSSKPVEIRFSTAEILREPEVVLSYLNAIAEITYDAELLGRIRALAKNAVEALTESSTNWQKARDKRKAMETFDCATLRLIAVIEPELSDYQTLVLDLYREDSLHKALPMFMRGHEVGRKLRNSIASIKRFLLNIDQAIDERFNDPQSRDDLHARVSEVRIQLPEPRKGPGLTYDSY